jgi:hypothetical protein
MARGVGIAKRGFGKALSRTGYSAAEKLWRICQKDMRVWNL